MAVTKIRGSTQIIAGTITNTEIDSAAAIATSKLADGAEFLQRDGSVALTGDFNANSNKITGLAEPTGASDAATKGYVDGIATGLDIKASVRAATTPGLGNLADLAAVAVGMDGVTLVAGDRVLVKNQTLPEQNGIYVVGTVVGGTVAPFTRATDANSDAKVTPGLFCFVEEGTVNADTGWVLSADAPITLGTTELPFTQFSSAGAVTAGAGMTQSGQTLNVVSANSAIVANADDIELVLNGGTLAISSGLKVADGGIAATQLADGAVVEAKIGTGAVTEDKIGTGAVTATKIGAGAVVEAKIGTGAVTTDKIADSNVTTVKIADGNVTEAKINTAAVTVDKIGSGAVTAVKIGTAAVTEAKIDTGAVTADKIGTAAVTEAKIGTGAVTADKVGTGAVTEAKIGTGAVTTAKLGDDSVTSDKLHSSVAGTGITFTDGVLTPNAAVVVLAANYVVRETPSAAGADYTLANTPVAGSEQVYLNGILQDEGGSNDYTISGAVITFNTAPEAGDKVRVTYLK